MLTVFLVLALMLAPVILRPSPAARRMMEMVQSNRPDERSVGNKERVQEDDSLHGQGACSIRLGLTEDEKVKQQLLSAGLRSSRSMNAYSASRYRWSSHRPGLRKPDSHQHRVLGFVSGRRLLSCPGHVAEDEDQETERKNQEEPSGRARSAGYLRGGRAWVWTRRCCGLDRS